MSGRAAIFDKIINSLRVSETSSPFFFTVRFCGSITSASPTRMSSDAESSAVPLLRRFALMRAISMRGEKGFTI